MARKRASMREGPLAELFRATEAAQRGQPEPQPEEQQQASEPTVEPDAPAASSLAEEQETIVIPPEPAPPVRHGDVSLEATVEHVYDFELPDEPAAGGRTGARRRAGA